MTRLRRRARSGVGPTGLKVQSWLKNGALSGLQARYLERYDKIGRRYAHRFTQDGHCGLFREGMKLAGQSPTDDAIKVACAIVRGEEFSSICWLVSSPA